MFVKESFFKEYLMISVVLVDVSDDLRYAKIYLSIYNNNDNIDLIIKEINKKKNAIKFKMGNKLKAKYVPEIFFLKSDEYAYLDKMNNLINKSLDE